jgi:hypothetical protein
VLNPRSCLSLKKAAPQPNRKTASLQPSVAQQYTSFIGVEFNACVSGNMLIEWQLREYSYLPGRQEFGFALKSTDSTEEASAAGSAANEDGKR